jgi:pyrrolidone-carboxylate peptidase
MTRLLVTGFEPFGGDAVNPSELVAAALAAFPAHSESLELHKLVRHQLASL